MVVLGVLLLHRESELEVFAPGVKMTIGDAIAKLLQQTLAAPGGCLARSEAGTRFAFMSLRPGFIPPVLEIELTPILSERSDPVQGGGVELDYADRSASHQIADGGRSCAQLT
jgi:hypothetical protein